MSLLGVMLLLQTAGAGKAVPASAPTTAPVIARPWEVGEKFTYKASARILVAYFGAGDATLSVLPIETIRGVPSWKFSLITHVSYPGHKDTLNLTSWTGVSDFISRRFMKVTSDTSVNRPRVEDFNIYPDSGFFRRGNDTGTKAVPKEPLDDVAILYFLRMMPLNKGQTKVWQRYFRKSVLDIKVTVSDREQMTLYDGSKVWCLVLNPVVEQANGMFKKDAKAKLWITDDARRIPVRIESSYSWGRVKLELNRMEMPRTK